MRATLPQVLDAAISGRLKGTWVSDPAIVQDYDPATQTATVRLATTDDGEPFDLFGVRVGHLRAGGIILHMPIAAGDSVRVLFASRDAEAWQTTGEPGDALEDGRLTGHAPIAIPCDAADPDALATGAALAAMGAPTDRAVLTSSGESAPVARADLVAAYLKAILAALAAAGMPVTVLDPRPPFGALSTTDPDVAAVTLNVE